MTGPVLHPETERQVANLLQKPPHALLVIGPSGAGKGTLARHIAAQLLGVEGKRLDNDARFRSVSAPAGKSISIDTVRDITHFLMLRSAIKRAVERVVLIEHAGDMTLQAQNALLKTIEEPPFGTTLILTVAHDSDVLPTIRSRTQAFALVAPSHEALKTFFGSAGYSATAVDKAMLMSDGLPGLTQALLADDTSHPLVAAADNARQILQKSTFERLVLIDQLSKDKQAWLDTLFIVQRMAQINLEKPGGSEPVIRKWHHVLSAALEAQRQTLVSAQLKLVALHFMLEL